jgi:hypothetical protein
MSSQVFKDQDLLTITLETGNTATTGADSAKIYYVKPSGVKGSWTAVIDETAVKYDIQTGDIDEAGTWQFESEITTGGLSAQGTVTKIKFSTSIK